MFNRLWPPLGTVRNTLEAASRNWRSRRNLRRRRVPRLTRPLKTFEFLEDRRLLAWDPLGSEFRVNTSTSGDQLNVAVDADAAGNYVAVWQSPNVQGYGTTDVHLQRFNAEGTPLGLEQRVHADWRGEQTQPDIAVADNGVFVVTWVASDGDSTGIFARRFAADATPLSDEFRVNTFTTGEQTDPEIAINPSDASFVVVWQSSGQDGSSWGVYGQRYAADGTASGSEFKVNSYTTNEQSAPAVAMNGSGAFVVGWRSSGQDGSSWGVYGQRYAADGTAQGSEFRANTYTSSEQRDPAVAMDGSGNFVLAWHSSGQDGSGWGIYGQRYAADGTAQGSEFKVNSYTSSDQVWPAVAMDATGEFIVTWQSNQDGSGYGIYAQRFAADGTTVDGEFRVNTYTSNDQADPAVTYGAGGEALIGWESYDQDGSAWGMYARVHGSGLGEPDLVPVRVTAPVGANRGQTIDLSSRIRNQGSVAAGTFSFRYYLSTDATITAADAPVGGVVNVSGLAAYATHSDSRQVQVPLDAPTGDLYVGVLVDTNNEVVEADESNNGAASGAFPPLDLRSPPATIGGEFRINRSTASDQRDAAVDADAAGNYVVVWETEHLENVGGTWDIYMQRFNAEGTPLGREQRVNPDWRGNQTNPDVAVADDGAFIVTWNSNDGNGWGIYARRFAANGSPSSDPILVNAYTTGDQTEPKLAINATTGEFVVVWNSNGQDGSGLGVYGQRFSASGAPQGPEFRVNSRTQDDQSKPAVAMDLSRAFWVVWQSYGQDGSSWGVYGQRYAADGTKEGGEFLINAYTGSHQQYPDVAVDAYGNSVVAWTSQDQDGNALGVFAQRFSSGGDPLGDEFRVSTYTVNNQYLPSVAMDAGGDFVVAWQSYGQDGSDYGIYAQRFAASGEALGGEFRVNTNASSDQDTPAVAFGVGGDFFIAWQSGNQDGWDEGVYGQIYGNGLSQPDLVPARVSAPTGVNLGQTIEVKGSIRNQGSLEASSFTAQYYLSSDNVITPADTPLGSAFSVAGIAAYATCADTQTFAVPDLGPGDYYVGLIVDTTNAVVEADETNNAYRPSFDEPVVNIAELPLLGPEQRANTTTNDEQSGPAVGLDAAGNCIAVWPSKNQDGSGYGVYGQRFDAAGSPVGSEFRVNTTTSGDQRDPSIAVAPDGSFVVAWESNGQDGSGWGVYAQRFDANGTPVDAEFRVNTYTNSDQSDPSITMDGTGNFIVAWRSNAQDTGNNGGIYAQRYSADGTPNGPEFWVCSNAIPDQQRPQVAANNGGQFVVVWDDGYTVFARRFSADGSAAGDDFQVNTYGNDQQNTPTVGIDATGNFVVAWASNGEDGSGWGVYAQRFTSDGTMIGEEFRVNARTVDSQQSPVLATDAAGNLVVVWQSYAQDEQYWGVFARRYAPDGSPLGGEFRVNSFMSSDQSRPALAVLDLDHFLVAWESGSQDGSSYGIYSQLSGVSGENSRPNLTVSQLAAPGSVTLGQTVPLTLTIDNLGVLVSPPTTAHLWLSDDGVFGNGDDLDTGIDIPVPEILSDAWNNTFQTTVNYTWPAADPYGTDRNYFFFVQADANGEVTEVSEEDNTRVSNTVHLQMPDLRISGLSAPSNVQAAQQVDVTVTVYNGGDTTAGPSVAHLWLSDDNVLGNGDDVNLFLDLQVPTLNSSESSQGNLSFAWPTTDPFGTDRAYYLIAAADVTDSVVESNETNNVTTRSIHLQMANLTGWVSAPSSVVPGQDVPITVRVRNSGDLQAPASTAHLWLSDDNVIGNADDLDLAIDIAVPLVKTYSWPDNTYQEFTTTVNYTWPLVDPFGTDGQYYFVLRLDVNSEVEESNESDNGAVSNSFGINRPNLIVSSLSAPSQVDPGQQVTVTVQVQNTGTAAADPSKLALRLSDDDVAGNADDQDLGIEIDVPALGTTSSTKYFTTSVPFTWPNVDPFGTDLRYYLAAKADATGLINEGNEDDNWRVSSAIQVRLPDLEAVRLQSASTVQADQQLVARLDVRNLGLLDMPASTAHVCLSDNNVVGDADDRELSPALDVSLPAVAAGASWSGDVTIPWPAVDPFETDGEYFVAVTLDKTNQIVEGNEANNVVLSPPLSWVVPMSLDVQLAGHYGGLSLGIAVQGDYAYELTSDGLRVLDITHLPQMTKVFEVPYKVFEVPYVVTAAIAMHIDGQRLYEVDPTALRIFDISTAHEPHLVAEHPVPPGYRSVAFSGSVAFIGDAEQEQLDILDLSEPNDPALLAEYDLRGSLEEEMLTVAIAGSRAYLGYSDDLWSGKTALEVVDVSALSQPAFVSRRTFEVVSTPVQAAVSGTLLALKGWDNVALIDVANPALPRLRGQYSDEYWGGYIPAMHLSGSTLQVVTAAWLESDGAYGRHQVLSVIDVSDPSDPAAIGAVDLDAWANPSAGAMLATQGAWTFVAGEGLSLVDISDPFAPLAAGRYWEPGAMQQVALAGSLLAAAMGNWLGLVDVSDPSAPELVGSYTASRPISRIAVDGRRLALAEGRYASRSGRVEVIDVSDASAPALLSSYDVPDEYLLDAALGGDLLYVLAGNSYSSPSTGTLSLVDLADPAQPTAVSTTSVFLNAASTVWDPDTAQYRDSHAELAMEDGRVYVSNTHPIDAEPNDTQQTAVDLGELAAAVAIRGVLRSAGDTSDWYRFQGSQGSRVRIDLRGYREGAGTFRYGSVNLYRSSGSWLAGSGYREDGTEEITIELPATGDYYLSVYEDYGYIRSYELALALDEALPPPQPFNGLSVYDTSDPESLELLATANVSRLIRGFTAANGGIYLTQADPPMLQVVDFSDPANPVMRGSAQVERWGPVGLADALATVTAPGRVQFVDVGDPHRPVALESLQLAGLEASAVGSGILYATAGGLYAYSVRVEGADAADLTATRLTVPERIQIGRDLNVEWTVRNQGREAAQAPWTDSIYLSPDARLDLPGDSLITEVVHNDPLNPLSTYNASAAVPTAGLPAGTYFVIVHTDSAGDVDEAFVEGNNVRVSTRPVILGLADLALTAVTHPAEVNHGGQLQVSWVVENLGPAPAQNPSWTDAVFLSTTGVLDGSQIPAGTVERTTGLDVGQTYAASLLVDTTQLVDADYFVIVMTDFGRVVAETNETNNTGAGIQPLNLRYPDLTVTHIAAPTVINRGDVIDVTWTVYNRSPAPAGGNWKDELYLIDDPAQPQMLPLSLALVDRTGGLNGRTTYQATATVNTALIADGQYWLVAKTDLENAVYESGEEGNNERSLGPIRIGVPEVTLGQPLQDAFDSSGQSKYYRVDVEAGQHLFVRLDDDNNVGHNELYIKYGSVPTRSDYDAKYSRNLAADQQVEMPVTRAGRYYILIFGEAVPDAPGGFAVAASTLEFQILGISPVKAGNAGEVTVTIRGAQFPVQSEVVLVSPSGAEITPLTIHTLTEGVITATFDLTGAMTGPYDVRVDGPLASAVTENVIQVSAGIGANFQSSLQIPNGVRVTREGVLWLEYSNEGDADAPAPLFVVKTDLGGLRLDTDSEYRDTVQILGINWHDPAGVLPPGSRGRFPIYFRSDVPGTANFSYEVTMFNDRPMDWDAIEADIRPPDVSSEDWQLVRDALQSQIGTTWDDYLNVLRENAQRLALRGQVNFSVSDLFRLEVEQARGIETAAIAGRVVDHSTGQAISGVLVSAYDDSGVLRAQITTRSDGAFLLPYLRASDYTLDVAGQVIVAGGNASVQKDQDTLGITVLVRKAGTLSGAVVDAVDNVPLGGIDVTIIGQVTRYEAATTTSESGVYSFDQLPADAYTVTAQSSIYVPTSVPAIIVAFGDEVENVDLGLTEGATVAGFVTAASNGEPVSGAWLSASNDRGEAKSSWTDENGHYSVKGLRQGTWTFTIDHTDFPPMDEVAVVATYGVPVHQNFQLASGAAVSGNVSSATGSSVQGAVVVAQSSLGLTKRCVTDVNGDYQLTGLVPDTYTLSVQMPGYSASLQKTGPLREGEASIGVDFVLSLGRTVSGLVTRTDGTTPVAGAEVILRDSSGIALYLNTGKDGTFAAHTLSIGVCVVEVRAAGFVGAQQLIALTEGSILPPLHFVLDTGSSVAGVVTKADGLTPVRNAVIQLLDGSGNMAASTITDGDGRYVLGPVVPSIYDLVTHHSYYSFTPLTVDLNGVSTSRQDILAGDSRLFGTTTDQGTGAPVTAGTVRAILLMDGKLSNTFLETQVAANGAFEFDSIVGGEYLLVTENTTLGRYLATAIVPSGEDVNVDIELGKGFTLSGSVTDAAGLPIENALVRAVNLQSLGTDPGIMVASDSDGHYAITGLSSDQYRLSVYARSHSLATHVLSLTQSMTKDVTLDGTGYTLDGAIVDRESRVPIPNALLILYQAGSVPILLTSDESGVFSVEGLLSGEYQLDVAFGGSVSRHFISISADTSIAVDHNILPHPASFDLNRVYGETIQSVSSMALATRAAAQEPPSQTSESLRIVAKLSMSSSTQVDFATIRRAIALSNMPDVDLEAHIKEPGKPRCKENEELEAQYEDLLYQRTLLLSYVEAAKDRVNGLIGQIRLAAGDLERDLKTYKIVVRVWILDIWVPISLENLLTASDPEDALRGAILDVIWNALPWDFILYAVDIVMTAHFAAEKARLYAKVLENRAETLLRRKEEAENLVGEIDDVAVWYNEKLAEYEAMNRTCAAPDPNEPNPTDPPPGNPPGGGGPMPVPAACEPNDKRGPAGAGDEHFVAPGSVMPYTVFYENDPEKATAPAMLVEIEDYLSSDLDWSTFELADINLYSDFWVDVPEGLQHWEYTVDLRPEGKDLLVEILADFDSDTGLAYWSFQSLDPETLEEPLDPFAGFLSHLNENNANDGSASYVVYAKGGLPTGTVIENFAVSTFDRFSSDTTPTVFNTIDAGKPTSMVNALPATAPDGPLAVTWAGQDDAGGSGVGMYTIYAKQDDGPWTVWLENTPLTSGQFIGVGGHRYAFRSVAKDNVGHVEDDPGVEEAWTFIDFSQLRVVDLRATASGFVAAFKRGIDPSALNLYDVEAATYGPADFTVVGENVGPVAGSLVYDPAAKTVTFVKTGGPLAADSYTVTLRSATDGFKDVEWHLLDGDANDVEGGDFVTTVVVQPAIARRLSLPDFSRGPGQAVNVPATGAGIPLMIDDAAGLLGMSFVLEYDPALLSVSDVKLGGSMPADWGVEINLATPGNVPVVLYGATPLAAGAITLAKIEATIPQNAPYRTAGIVGLHDVQLNDGAIPALVDSALQTVAYLGDATGNGQYSALDASYIARVSVGRDAGFAPYRLKDPILIGDASGSGGISALDAAYVARKVVGRVQPEIPDLPPNLPVLVPMGPDPVVTMPTIAGASLGETIMRGVTVDDAAGLLGMDLTITYDTSVLDLADDDVQLGGVLAGWTLVTAVNDAAGLIRASAFTADDPLPHGGGALLQITYHVRNDAPAGTSALNLVESGPLQCLLNEGQLVMTPVDGSITVIVHPWQNSANRYDADNNGDITANDALVTINYINNHGTGPLPIPPPQPGPPPPYYDVSGDDEVTAKDVLQVINYLNSHPLAAGSSAEGEYSGATDQRLESLLDELFETDELSSLIDRAVADLAEDGWLLR